MFGLQEIIRSNELAVERQREDTGARLEERGLINCLNQGGLTPQCSKCPNYTICLELSQALR